MSGRIAGKVALITGGASGIGAACARRFAAEGARVVITDLQADKGAAVAAEISGDFLSQDVVDEARWREVVAEVLTRHGRLDILVNNAGIIGGGSVEDCDLDNWNRVMAVNVTGTMLGCKHGVGAM
jgi:3(or 17)beta-hydroxysteroid dehydrogenase